MRAVRVRYGKEGHVLSAEEILAAREASERGGNIVFCVGSVLRGDDAAGPLLAKKLDDFPVEGWSAVDGGQTPENDLGYLRRLAPNRLLLVDAAAMGLTPGDIRRLKMQDVVVFLGVQPAGTEFFDPVHPRVLAAVEHIYQNIAQGGDFEKYPYVN